jgi:2-keto-3-deoxy-L-rhamnonate aldolase RhmA
VQTSWLPRDPSGITPIVRIPSLDVPLILRLLDVGTECIQLDGIRTADEARALVDAMKFPPLGSRGLIWNSRAANYGRVDKKTYARLPPRGPRQDLDRQPGRARQR